MEETIMHYLKEHLDEIKLKHTFGVMETAVKLAEHYDYDVKKAKLTALLHDCARLIPVDDLIRIVKERNIVLDEYTKKEPILMHAVVGSIIATEKFGIVDSEILNAITNHTTGKEGMKTLDKIIFLADTIEPNRDFTDIEKIREMSYINLDQAVIMAIDSVTKWLEVQGRENHPDSIALRNSLLKEAL